MWYITFKTINCKIQINYLITQIYGKGLIPVHKKNDKQLVRDYRPISLLPIFGDIFEKIIFNKVYHFLLEERLLNPNQSGFCSSDSCINTLLAITHEIIQAFDCNPPLEVKSFFLDISKAFDKVWHESLFYKLRPVGISESFITFLKTIFQKDTKGSFYTGKIRRGDQF